MTSINVQEKDLMNLIREYNSFGWSSYSDTLAIRLLGFSVLRAKEIVYFVEAALKYFDQQFPNNKEIKKLPEKKQKVKLNTLKQDLLSIHTCFHHVERIAGDMVRFFEMMNNDELAKSVFNDEKSLYGAPMTITEFKNNHISIMINELKKWESSGYKLMNRYTGIFFWRADDDVR